MEEAIRRSLIDMHYFRNKITMLQEIKAKMFECYPVQTMFLQSLIGKKRKEMKYVLSEDYKFIFVPIQKVATTSLVGAFLPLALGVRQVPRELIHFMPLVHISKRMLKDYRNNGYFVFTFVRNPFDRLVSNYGMQIRSNKNVTNKGFINGVSRWLLHYSKDFYGGMPFEEYAQIICQIPDSMANVHFMSQHKLICDRRGRILVDYVGRFENVNEDFGKICKRIGVSLELKHHGKSKERSGMNYQSFYVKKTQEIVRCRYEKDINIFGYEF